MKTPKRQAEEWESYLLKAQFRMNENRIKYARWKRKNRIAQYKSTIARLTQELRREREYCRSLRAAYASLAEQLTERKETK